MNKYIIPLLFLLLTACTQKEISFESHSFPNAGWDMRQGVPFKVSIQDTSIIYDITVEFRHNDQYPYRNIWLFVDYETPSGIVRTDTLGDYLADTYGKWLGKGISLYSFPFTYQENIQYPDTGTYIYTIRHGMRSDVLTGVSDIGLRISKK